MRNTIKNMIFEIMKKSFREFRRRARLIRRKNTQFIKKRV